MSSLLRLRDDGVEDIVRPLAIEVCDPCVQSVLEAACLEFTDVVGPQVYARPLCQECEQISNDKHQSDPDDDGSDREREPEELIDSGEEAGDSAVGRSPGRL